MGYGGSGIQLGKLARGCIERPGPHLLDIGTVPQSLHLHPVMGMGFLSRTLDLPGQRGAVIILQDDQVWGGVLFAVLCLRLICSVRKRFVI